MFGRPAAVEKCLFLNGMKFGYRHKSLKAKGKHPYAGYDDSSDGRSRTPAERRRTSARRPVNRSGYAAGVDG